MNQQMYLRASGVIFGLVALFHLGRIFLGWNLVFNGYAIPVWMSAVGLVVAAFLSYMGCKLGKLI